MCLDYGRKAENTYIIKRELRKIDYMSEFKANSTLPRA